MAPLQMNHAPWKTNAPHMRVRARPRTQLHAREPTRLHAQVLNCMYLHGDDVLVIYDIPGEVAWGGGGGSGGVKVSTSLCGRASIMALSSSAGWSVR